MTRGLIPATAGNARLRSLCWRPSRAHPRDCGERPIRNINGELISGSSPRLRGTQELIESIAYGNGLIPATAGNALTPSWTYSKMRAHPRDCGERVNAGNERQIERGSSPRLRGTLTGPRKKSTPAGLIPATAGNAQGCDQRLSPSRAHPRDCGERLSATAPIIGATGSSPRLRGTPSHKTTVPSVLGLIPATAGNAA